MKKNVFQKRLRMLGVMCLIICFWLPAYTESQLSVSSSGKTLKQLIKQIEESTDYHFSYQGDLLEDISTSINQVDLSIPINDFLKEALKGTNLDFIIKENDIILKKAQSQPQSQPKKEVTIKGKVVDAENNETLIGASVWLKDTSIGVTTNVDGEFSLSFTGNYSYLVVSYIGYESQEVKIRKGEEEINISLKPSSSELEDVVVVGYGTQKKASIVGAISSIAPRDIKAPIAKISSNLAGNLSGVVAIQRSGEPGTGSTFWIRGISTFGANSEPLVLVDGVEREIDLVDPEDIKEFSILKDAAATAVYGVRGANGVVLITTRSGEVGVPKISVKMERGIVTPTKVPDMIDAVQYAEMYNDAAGYTYYSEDAINKYRTGEDSELFPNVDWVSELYKNTSRNTRINTNVTGGTNTVKYFVSGGYYDENGLFTVDNLKAYNTSVFYRRFNFRANVDMKIARYTTLNVNLATSFERKNEPGTSGSTIWEYALMTPSNAFPMVYSNGYLPGPGSNQGYNPYSLLTQTGYVEKFHNTAQSLFGITQDLSEYITKGLIANVKASFDVKNYNYLGRTRTAEEWQAMRNSEGEIEYNQLVKGSESLSYSENHSGRRTVYLEGSLNYARTFGLHNVTGLFLYQQSQKNYTGVSTSENALPYRNQGIAGRFTYNYDSRYFLEGNFGYNGSENFSTGNRFGFFPSIAAGWVVSDEKFFQPLNNVVDMLKFKTSYGLVGNDEIGGDRRFIYLETIESGASFPFGQSVHTESSIRMGEWANNNVSWETSRKFDLGIDISLFNKLKIQADYFSENRSGIFLARQAIPYYVGLTNKPYVNIGKMRNKGFDSSFEYHQKIKDFKITARGNFTYARNVILDQDQPDYKYLYMNRTGQSRYQSFGYVAAGLFKDQEDVDSWADQSTIGGAEPGDIKYLDLNGDGIINSYDVKAIGYRNIPEIVYGFGASLNWKAFDFSIFFQGNAHVDFSIRSDMVQGFINKNINQSNVFSDIYNNYWTPERTDAKYPRLTTSQNANNDATSTFWMVDGSYLRIKNVEFGYTLPKAASSRLGINGLRIYFSGVNLCTFSNFKLWDPDLQTGATSYPPNTVFNIGFSAAF